MYLIKALPLFSVVWSDCFLSEHLFSALYFYRFRFRQQLGGLIFAMRRRRGNLEGTELRLVGSRARHRMMAPESPAVGQSLTYSHSILSRRTSPNTVQTIQPT